MEYRLVGWILISCLMCVGYLQISDYPGGLAVISGGFNRLVRFDFSYGSHKGEYVSYPSLLVH